MRAAGQGGGLRAPMEQGYLLGLASIKEALTKLCRDDVRDVHYWKDSIRWLGKTCNLVRDRSFAISALQIMQKAHEILGDSVKVDILLASCSIQASSADVDVLDKILRLTSAIVSPIDAKDHQVHQFISSVTEIVISSGDINSVRIEIIPNLLRICGILNASEHLISLSELILQSEDVSGKILWTLADVLCEKISFSDKGERWISVSVWLAQSLIATSSLKAKWHVARTCHRIHRLPDCPENICQYIKNQMQTCLNWIERAEVPPNLDIELYSKYREGLLSELTGG